MTDFKGKTKTWLRGYISSGEEQLTQLETEAREVRANIDAAKRALSARKSTAQLSYETIRATAQTLTQRHGEFSIRQLGRACDISYRSANNYIKRMMKESPPIVRLVAIRDIGGGIPQHRYAFVKPDPQPSARPKRRAVETEAVAAHGAAIKRQTGPVRKVVRIKTGSKEMDDLLKACRKAGAEVWKESGSNHWGVAIAGRAVTGIAGTPGDIRTPLNERARIRRELGLDV